MSPAVWWERVPAEWRSERMLVIAGLSLSLVFLIAFCSVVTGVVRKAELQHQAQEMARSAPSQQAVQVATSSN